MSGGGKAVCVTGASGYIASWLVKVLLHRGYTVRATVRDTDDPKRTHHLLKLDGAEERLQLFKADLVEEGSFDSAVDGCDGVFHTASPVIVENVKEPQAELIGPALRGTINVLKSCAKVASIKRVVLTSSVAAVAFTGKPTNPDDIIDETWFSNSDFCEASKLWYHLSKTLAEEAAWKFSKENGIDLVVINPVYVIGPPLQPTINYTVKIILDLLGAPTYPNGTFQYVDVRDVANAHIQAFEVPSASGRYCLLEGAAHFSEIVKTIRQLFPHLQLPEKCVDDDSYPACNVSKEKAKSLGIEFIPLEVSLRDTIESLIEKNCISF